MRKGTPVDTSVAVGVKKLIVKRFPMNGWSTVIRLENGQLRPQGKKWDKKMISFQSPVEDGLHSLNLSNNPDAMGNWWEGAKHVNARRGLDYPQAVQAGVKTNLREEY